MANTHSSPAPRRHLTAVALVGVLLLTVVVYMRGLNGDFQFDDSRAVQFNRGIHDLGQFLTLSSLKDAFHGRRIVTEFTFALNYWTSGNDPFAYHVTNLAIHLAATLMAFLLARRIFLLGGIANVDGLALAVTAIFALHPLQTQAVIYLSQRSESLASALYLGSLLLLMWAEKRGLSVMGVAIYGVAFFLFALGLAAKVIVATLPAAYLLVGILPGPHRPAMLARAWKRFALAVPLGLYAVSITFLTVTDLKGVDAGFAVPLMPPTRYFLTQWHVVATYVRLLVWPTGQNVDWDFPLAGGFWDVAVLSSGLFLAALVAGAAILYFRCRRRLDTWGEVGRLSAFGVFWFFLLLSPTSTVVPVVDVLMEHRIYLASWGAFLALAVLTRGLFERLARPQWFSPVVVCVCAGLAFASCLRVGLWQTKLSLWSDCVAKSPRKARAHLGLGNALGKEGDLLAAMAELRTALELARVDPLWLRQEIRGKLGTSSLMLGRPDDAVAYAQAGLVEQPKNGSLLGLLAVAYLNQRNLPGAEAAAEASVRASPEPASSLQILSRIRRAKNDKEGEVAALEQAVQMDPSEPQGRLLLAIAYHEQGRLQQACEVLRAPAMERLPQVTQMLADCLSP